MEKYKASRLAIVLLTLIVTSEAIMRPVYKVALTQTKNVQYLQYDLDTPPIKEFTFCAWLKLFVTDVPQFIFTYIINGHRHLSFWLEKGGNFLKISFSGKTYSSFPVNFTLNIWNHVCLTYQSNYGAWAVYLDREFLSCGAKYDIMRHIFPGGGSIIVGHGMTPKGDAFGIEGEVYGVNMILKSIDKESFIRNQLKPHVNKSVYTVFKDVALEEFFKSHHSTKDYRIEYTTPDLRYTTFRNDEINKSSEVTVNGDMQQESTEASFSKNSSNLRLLDKVRGTSAKPDIISESPRTTTVTSKTSDLPLISVYETPPPPSTPILYNTDSESTSMSNHDKTTFSALSTTMSPPSELPPFTFFTESWSSTPVYNKDFLSSMEKLISMLSKQNDETPSEIEMPPPLQDNTKYYGQWSNSDFAQKVLTYLRGMNYRNRIPATLPLRPVSDSLPYASTVIKKVNVPTIKRKKLRLSRRSIESYKKINVKILSDWRENIQTQHSGIKPRNVEITTRGQSTRYIDWPRLFKDTSIEESSSEHMTEKDINVNTLKNIDEDTTVVPFLKTLQYFLDSSKKWHNVSPYSKPYTPRQINMDLLSPQNTTTEKTKQKERLKFKCSDREDKNDDDMIESKETQNNSSSSEYMDVIPQSTRPTLRVDMLKTVNALHDMPIKKRKESSKESSELGAGNFNRMIKIGNALNEWSVIGLSQKEKNLSFINGNDDIPDINKHRSENDDNLENVPPSLLSEACQNFMTTNRLLPYVQKDINYLGTEFISINFDRCSYENVFSPQFDSVLFINWETTPVRLYGGAKRLESVDLCRLH